MIELKDCGNVMCEYKLLENIGWSEEKRDEMIFLKYSFESDNIFSIFKKLANVFPDVTDYKVVKDVPYYKIDINTPFGDLFSDKDNFSDINEAFVKITSEAFFREICDDFYYDGEEYYKVWYSIVRKYMKKYGILLCKK